MKDETQVRSLEGADAFLAGLNTLLVALDESKARIVFVTPPPHELLPYPLPDPTEHNRDLKLYAEAIVSLAAKRRAPVVNLFELLGKNLQPVSSVPLTDNGIHLTPYGYWRAAIAIESGLGLPKRRWQIEIDTRDQNIAARGTNVSHARFSATRVAFAAQDQQLPLGLPPAGSPAESASVAEPRVVRVFNLPPGNYALKIGGSEVASAPAASWTSGVTIAKGPDFEQAEQLRREIVAKNLLYFHRWRPQNETYLLGFRKHEQGQNAIEIPQFDPLVAAKEASIRTLAAPRERDYELIRVDAK